MSKTIKDVMDKTNDENKALAAERDALAAQVEALKTWRNLALQFDGQRVQAMGLLKMIATGHFDMRVIQKFVADAPVSGDAHLAEIKAEAGRAGWLACLHEAEKYIDGYYANILTEADADRYAATVRKGGCLMSKTIKDVMDKTNDENKALAAERDALKDQLAAVVSLAKELAHDAYWNASDRNRSDRDSEGFDADVRQQFEDHWARNDKDKLLPEMCLAEIKAEAGRAGYLEAALNFDPDYDADWSAGQYAATVRKGGS